MARELWARLQLSSSNASSWRQRLEQHTYCVAEELDEEDGIQTIEREASSRESHATVRMRTTLGSEAPRVQVPASDTNQSRTLQYGESENTGKLTGSRMRLIERGLGAKPVGSNAKARSASCRFSKSYASAAAVVRSSERTICDVAFDEELEDEEELRTSRARTWAARMQGESNV